MDDISDNLSQVGKRDDDVKINVDQIDISEDSSTPSFKADKVGSDCSSPLISGSAYNSTLDLNMMVDEILTSKRHPSIRKEKKRRFKMTYEQAQILEAEYQKDPNWTHEKYMVLCSRLQTSKARIYKWNWDRKRRDMS